MIHLCLLHTNSIVITLNCQVEVAVGKEAEEELVDISHTFCYLVAINVKIPHN